MLDSKKGTSLGFGFVRFSTPDAVTRAIKDMHRCRLDNKTLLVKHSNIPRTKDYFPSCETLFIRGLSRHTTPESITSFCSQIEPPSLVRVSNDFGSSRTESCVAYVRFNSIEAANRVRTALNHTLFPGSFTPIEIAFAKRNLLDHPPKPSKSHKLTPRQKKSAFPAKQKSTPRPFQFPPSNVPELSLHSEPPLPPDLPLTWRSPSTGSFLDPLPSLPAHQKSPSHPNDPNTLTSKSGHFPIQPSKSSHRLYPSTSVVSAHRHL
ncbi:hypothetical protein BLNAU_19082 [Blattamonas nauphoetae]|uniref:RRM domain-containing protein n=1 Tax=Blattamonas nauphoetae TaxID=2049346 RepID=A0ABQ9X2J9_9EUKA|nr:hypothetical protein BLNAU_19082 [Blattamonas nauphoetae]